MSSTQLKRGPGRPRGPKRADLCISAPAATIKAFKARAAAAELSHGKFLASLLSLESASVPAAQQEAQSV